MTRLARAALAIGVLAGCRVDPLDLTGTPCPCPAGWICDPQTSTCARDPSAVEPDAPPGSPDAAPDIATALAFHFRFDQTTGQQVLDSSPTMRHGYAYNATSTMWTTGRVGGGMHFTGVPYQSFVMFPTSDSSCDGIEPITGSFTASAWVRFDSFQDFVYTLSDIVAMHGSAGGNEGGWGIGATNGCDATTHTASISVAVPMNGGRANRCGTTPLAAATWYHVTGVYDASVPDLLVYLNGELDTGEMTPGSAAIPAAIQAQQPTSCIYLASSANQNKLLFGTLDEFRLYTRALTAREVAELYRVSQ